MPGLITLAIFFLALSFFVGGYFLSSTFYYKKNDVKYSFKRMFPYEFNYPNAFKNNIYGNIAFVISIVGAISFYIYFMSVCANKTVPLYIIIVLAILISSMIACLFFMPLQFLRTHIVVSSLTMVFAFAIPALECCYVLPLLKNAIEDGDKVLYVISLVVGVLLSLAMLIFSLNPKATYKIYLDKSVDKNGNEVMMRPSFIPIAFNEWWSIFTFVLSPIPFIIINFI